VAWPSDQANASTTISYRWNGQEAELRRPLRITLTERLGSIGRGSAWVDYLIVGTLRWRPVFAGIDGIPAFSSIVRSAA
jgi:hypothetical protein